VRILSVYNTASNLSNNVYNDKLKNKPLNRIYNNSQKYIPIAISPGEGYFLADKMKLLAVPLQRMRVNLDDFECFRVKAFNDR
jgi:hypothetical protein